ncbi:MAG TPA: hypothetical protein VFJ76_01910 [Solirubrobacterales bacterium]|nr:hypothetical protein [Solirubrobacterales bacterium]
MAMTAAGWTAIGAVGGALVGAAAGGTVDWLLGLHRENALGKAGARLVAGEIAGAESQLASAQNTRKWWPFYGIPIESWEQYRDVLAVKLNQEEFEAVSQAIMALEHLRRKLPETPRFKKEVAVQGFLSVDPEDIEPIRKDAAKAYNALSDLAGHQREGDLIRRPGDD